MRAAAGRDAAGNAPSAERLNWLRAAVLGANDGVVSVASILVGVAGASSDRADIAAAGIAGLVGGGLSMALGEYVSVSSAKDSQLAAAGEVAEEDIANPWHAGIASAAAFLAGAILPFVVMLASPIQWNVPLTILAALLALALTGALGARLGHAPVRRPVVRVVIGGALALGITFGVGALFGVAVA
ncbi:VIT1/CCC1 transporter family protein [Serinibacter salmoneus]|uniref:VIT1/CCC1 transporter family protein n=1 Tax=Serinibacter salmoneus TaxID=556530 RepID=UPI001474E04E|nr:VIT1/CCC1 transporter family protein [Serinibacter salmoneus]